MTKAIQYHNLVLLTGAGFTRNYGGFLAKDMWSKIFNYPAVQDRPEVRQALIDNPSDYEKVYSVILDSERYVQDDKMAIKAAFEQAYEDLDNAIKGWNFNSDNPTAFNTYGLGNLLNLFVATAATEKGFIFTLNQDLLMERDYKHRSLGTIAFPDERIYHMKGWKMERTNFITLPTEDEVQKTKANLATESRLLFVKLHGSYGWLSANQEQRMVIGKNKTNQIDGEPLLKWYFELFQSVLYSGNKKLLIIGYGFNDDHVNQVLLTAMKEHGLKLYIINPASPADFAAYLQNGRYNTLPLWEQGTRGYFPYTLREIFPPDQSVTGYFKDIKKLLTE